MLEGTLHAGPAGGWLFESREKKIISQAGMP
jgi:hypothetical protein